NPTELSASFASSQCKWLILSFSSDWLFPPFQSRQMANALISLDKPVSYCNVASTCGHDAFLLADDLPVYGEMIRGFLRNLDCDTGVPPVRDGSRTGGTPMSQPQLSIFHEQRLDYDTITSLIPAGATVLDLGCGGGGLLKRLHRSGHARVMGVEVDQHQI